ncbi:hypothetical protein SteCoe_29887 [Stentor coeruleus]|uniref:RNA polymerase II-associated protein 3 n=1 Tax=Stentor coeruleus TaxID=5963 RepID=A0A1R2B4X5_9CILI|nr:hypothetical protein SteCoe_29887 [Stentor coeruleus]
MGEKVVEVQNQIRNNANSIRDYIDELANWEAEINSIDSGLTNKTLPLSEPPPVRNPIKDSENPQAQTDEKLKRDKAKMKDYYKAWDKFDVDKELEKIEEKPTMMQAPKVMAKPQSKILIKGGNPQKDQHKPVITTKDPEVDRLKDQGNLAFSNKEYDKAIEKYAECLQRAVNPEMLVILNSNSSECFLRIKKPEQALEHAEKALDLDKKHVKSLVRRAKAKKMLGKFKSAKADLQFCLELEPNNTVIKQEIGKITAKVQMLLEDLQKTMTNKDRPSPDNLISIPVTDINNEKIEEVKKEVVVIKEQTTKAIESIAIEKLPIPKNLVEFERTWVMLSEPHKLRVYLESIPQDTISNLISKGNIESDFFMRIVNTFIDNFAEFQEYVQVYLEALKANKKFTILAKFLTKKEKTRVQELLGLIGKPNGFEIFY